MATRTALALRLAAPPAPRPGLARRAGRLARGLVLAAALVMGGAVLVLLLLLAFVVTMPLAAALVAWLAFRPGAAAREARRVRARLRRRARHLGLVVLAGSQPALLRLAGARATARRAP